jgi:GGDEF domain-containing protein
MISIRNALADLEQCHQERDLVMNCYLTAIRNVARYTIELDQQITDPQRTHLTALAADVVGGGAAVLEESRATLRGLLRDYRDKAAQYINGIRDELANLARALEEIMESLSQADGDHEQRLRNALSQLRSIPNSLVSAAADAIQDSVEQMRKQHCLTISQFQVEVRMLHKRIDSLEAAASLDALTQVFNRQETEERMRQASPECFLLLVRVNGFHLAASRYREDVAQELATAFTKRLRNGLPQTAVIGRWSHEEFVVILSVERAEASLIGKWISEHLSGAYACLLAGKSVRPSLQVNVAVLEVAGISPERSIERVKAFLTGE